ALESAYFIADEEVNLKLKMLLIRLKKYNLHLVLIGIILGNSLKKSTKKQNFMFNLAQPHGEKLAALLNNDKLPTTEKLRVGAGSPKISDSNQQSHKPAPSTRQNCHCFQNCHCEERSNLSLGDCFVPLFGQIILLNA
ncbi:MAG: hypothetical protein LH628_11345, partial [Microcoleus sp. CAN_BIN18]|nr:hypothetical protein [Microcoleus sp. CAN_BIN18]